VIGLGNASEAAGLWLLGNIFKKRGCRLYEPGIFPWWTLIRFGVCTICAYVGTSIQVCLGVMASAIWPFAYISWIIGDFLSLMILAPPTNTLLASLRRQTICWQVWKHVWEQDRNPQ
jgi:general stress protein CsbA